MQIKLLCRWSPIHPVHRTILFGNEVQAHLRPRTLGPRITGHGLNSLKRDWAGLGCAVSCWHLRVYGRCSGHDLGLVVADLGGDGCE